MVLGSVSGREGSLGNGYVGVMLSYYWSIPPCCRIGPLLSTVSSLILYPGVLKKKERALPIYLVEFATSFREESDYGSMTYDALAVVFQVCNPFFFYSRELTTLKYPD